MDVLNLLHQLDALSVLDGLMILSSAVTVKKLKFFA
jgi:hypothetical protein